MKKTERYVLAIATILLGILLIAFQERVIKTAVVALGIVCLVLAVIDFFNKSLPSAAVKGVAGVVIVLLGLFAVRAVLYLIAAVLLIAGILLVYERLRRGFPCGATLLQKIGAFALPALCFFVGILLLICGGSAEKWLFIVCGLCVSIEGGLLLAETLVSD